MSVMLDLIGSVVIAGFVILMGLRLNETISGSADSTMASLNVQESMAEIVRNVEYDFRKIGFNVSDPRTSIVLADSTHIRFIADMDRDGVIDTVEWYVGPPLATLPNPNVRVLYRSLTDHSGAWSGGGAAGLGVTQFHLNYFTATDLLHPMTFPISPSLYSTIWVIEVTLRVESPYKVQDAVNTENSQFVSAFWRKARVSSRNLKRHG
jgi:hypothetical protein